MWGHANETWCMELIRGDDKGISWPGTTDGTFSKKGRITDADPPY